MSDSIEAVKSLLKKHDYITILQKTVDGCIVTYPYPKLFYRENVEIPRLIECFAIQRGTQPGFWVNTSHDKPPANERFIEIPEYAMRLYIVCEIAACNYRIPIDPGMIIFVGNDNKEYNDIEDVIDGPTLESDKKREGFLYRLVVEARNDGFPPEYEKIAETHHVDEGYKIIRKFYAE